MWFMLTVQGYPQPVIFQVLKHNNTNKIAWI